MRTEVMHCIKMFDDKGLLYKRSFLFLVNGRQLPFYFLHMLLGHACLMTIWFKYQAASVLYTLGICAILEASLNTPPHVYRYKYSDVRIQGRAKKTVEKRRLSIPISQRGPKKDGDRPGPGPQRPIKPETEPSRREDDKGIQRVKRPKKRIGVPPPAKE